MYRTSIVIFISIIFCQNSYALDDKMLKIVTDNLESLCVISSKKGSAQDLFIKGNDRTLNLSKAKEIGVDAQIELTAHQWDGIQQVLKQHQHDENNSIRECKKFLTPIIVDALEKSYSSYSKIRQCVKLNSEACNYLLSVREKAERYCIDNPIPNPPNPPNPRDCGNLGVNLKNFVIGMNDIVKDCGFSNNLSQKCLDTRHANWYNFDPKNLDRLETFINQAVK